VDTIAGDVAQNGNHLALPLQPRNAAECRALDENREVRFAGPVIARVAAVPGAVIDDLEMGRGKGIFEELPHFLRDRCGHGFQFARSFPIFKRVRRDRFHGRHESRGMQCEWPGCTQQGEFRAPGRRRASFDGPGEWRWFCLDHIREFNSGYDYFEGMSSEQIFEEQSPLNGWDQHTRAFRTDAGVDGIPRWADFADPLEAISMRARQHVRERREAMRAPAPGRFSAAERRALSTLGLGQDADRKALRTRYTRLVRDYHPDHNGGDRSREERLRQVVEAYQLLRKATALS